jgi:hypothetical protein
MLFQLKKIGRFIFDVAASIVLFLLLPILKLSRKYGVENFPLQVSLFKRLGIFPIQDHYYEPRFVYDEMFDASIVREIPLKVDIAAQVSNLGILQNKDELGSLIASEDEAAKGFYVHNPNSVLEIRNSIIC